MGKSSGPEEGFLSTLFSLAGIGSKNVATTDRFEEHGEEEEEHGEEHNEEHTGGNETVIEDEDEHSHGHEHPKYFVLWRYLYSGDCEDGPEGGEYMTAFTGHTNECKYINDLKHGKLKCSEDGTTYTAEYYADDKCHEHTATFVKDEPTNRCHKINGNVWKATCSSVDLSPENPYWNCFAGSEMVHLETGESIPIEQVQVGDRIQVVSANGMEFADVVYLPHDKNAVEASFVQIESTGGKAIRMTPDHFILAGECDVTLTLIPAKAVHVGQRVGIIVVNGFKASSFAINHFFVNAFYDIHRSLYRYDLRFATLKLSTIMSYIGFSFACIMSL